MQKIAVVLAFLSLSSVSLAASPKVRVESQTRDQVEEVKSRVLAMADAFANEQLGLATAAPNSAVGCLERVTGLGVYLPCPVSSSEQTSAVSASQPPVRIKWSKKRAVSDWMVALGWRSLLAGFGVGILNGFIPVDVVHDSISVVSESLTSGGFGALVSGFVWGIFLPDPELALPVGVRKNSSRVSAPTTGDVTNVAGLIELFLNRVRQRGVQIPKGLNELVWLDGISAGLKNEDLASPEALLLARDRLRRRVEKMIQHPSLDPVGPRRAALETLESVIQRIELAPEFQRGLTSRLGGGDSWRNAAIPRLAQLNRMAERVFNAIRMDQLLDQFGDGVVFENQNTERLFRSNDTEMLAFSGVPEFLAKMPSGGQLRFAVENFEYRTRPENEVAGLVRFNLKVTYVQTSASDERADVSRVIGVEAATLAPSADVFFDMSDSWILGLTDQLNRQLTDIRIAMLSDVAAEDCEEVLEVVSPLGRKQRR